MSHLRRPKNRDQYNVSIAEENNGNSNKSTNQQAPLINNGRDGLSKLEKSKFTNKKIEKLFFIIVLISILCLRQ